MSLLLFYILLAPTTCTPFPHLFKRPAGLSLQVNITTKSIFLIDSSYFFLFNVFKEFLVEGDGSLPEVMKNYFRDNFWWRVHKTVVGLQISNGGEGGEDANDSLSSLEVVPLLLRSDEKSNSRGQLSVCEGPLRAEGNISLLMTTRERVPLSYLSSVYNKP